MEQPNADPNTPESNQVVAKPSKLVDYKSRKFLLTAASLAVFVVLLIVNKLTGEQFTDVYWAVFASYVLGNVAYNWTRK